MTEVGMPNLGMTMMEGKVLEWLVEDGADVTEGQELAEVASETEKLTAVIESPATGKIKIILEAGDEMVACGKPIATIE